MHTRALIKVATEGKDGETYNIGGHNEKQNIAVVKIICEILDVLAPQKGASYASQMVYVKDRPNHDIRYAIDASKIKQDLDWEPVESFESGIKKTIE